MMIVQPSSFRVIVTERRSSPVLDDELETVLPLLEDTETELCDDVLPRPSACECAEALPAWSGSSSGTRDRSTVPSGR
jgi:hypothetical protein